MSKILALLCSVLPEVGTDWERLAARASPNVFISPPALTAAAGNGNRQLKVIEAWQQYGDGEAGARQLVGLWALQKKRLLRFGPATLAAPPYEYAFVANPVVDADDGEAAVGALLDAIAGDPSLPKVLRLKHLDADADDFRALETALRQRGAAMVTVGEHLRPFATRSRAVKSSGSTRKKLRQDWNRLSALGAVDIVNETAPEAAKAAFEVFLAMEAASWKGANGTALLSDAGDAAFVRRLFDGLAAHGGASVALLRVEGNPIAAQVLFYSGAVAYTWKTAFDAAFARYSPGALLIDKVTEQLFASERIQAIESCSPGGSFMAQLWSGRRRTVDLLIDLSGKRSAAFRTIVLWEQGYQRLRALRDELRAAEWLPDPRRRARGAT